MSPEMFSEIERQQIADAITKVESTTSGEIVAVVARESSSYLAFPIMWSAIGALIVPWPLIYFTWWPVQSIYLLQLAVFTVLLGLFLLRPIRYALVPPAYMRQRAHRRAVEQFLVQDLHTTAGRTGVLIFVSVAERYAEIIADTGIHERVPQPKWQAIVDALTSAIGASRPADGFVGAISAVGAELAVHFPPGSRDPNELPNHLIVLS